jgi:hypothetical protein
LASFGKCITDGYFSPLSSTPITQITHLQIGLGQNIRIDSVAKLLSAGVFPMLSCLDVHLNAREFAVGSQHSWNVAPIIASVGALAAQMVDLRFGGASFDKKDLNHIFSLKKLQRLTLFNCLGLRDEGALCDFRARIRVSQRI